MCDETDMHGYFDKTAPVWLKRRPHVFHQKWFSSFFMVLAIHSPMATPAGYFLNVIRTNQGTCIFDISASK